MNAAASPVAAQLLNVDWGVPVAPGLHACCTLRSGGVSRAPWGAADGGGGANLGLHVGDDVQAVLQNRAALQQAMHTLSGHCVPAPAWLNQVHGAQVVDADTVVGTPAMPASAVAQRPAWC